MTGGIGHCGSLRHVREASLPYYTKKINMFDQVDVRDETLDVDGRLNLDGFILVGSREEQSGVSQQTIKVLDGFD